MSGNGVTLFIVWLKRCSSQLSYLLIYSWSHHVSSWIISSAHICLSFVKLKSKSQSSPLKSTHGAFKRRDHPIDALINEYLTLLSQSKFKKINRCYTQRFIDSTQKSNDSSNVIMSKYLTQFYNDLRSGQVDEYEVLIQYKLPFSKLGTERFLTYIKLKTSTTDRYIAVWFKRNVYGNSSWKIDDIYLNDTDLLLSLNIESNHHNNTYFYTLSGRLITDSTLTSLFFIRLFTDSDYSMYAQRRLSDSKQCHVDIIQTFQSQIQELLTTIYDDSMTQSLEIVSPRLRKRVEDFKSSHRHIASSGYRRDDSHHFYQILSLYQLPARSHNQTRILVHLYIPSTQRYFSIWFTRCVNQGLHWKIDDFYMHQFGEIKPFACADKEYCMTKFRTIKTRVFYMPDLLGDYLLGDRVSSRDTEKISC